MSGFDQRVQLRFRDRLFNLHVSGTIMTAVTTSPDNNKNPNHTPENSDSQPNLVVSLEEMPSSLFSSESPANIWTAEFSASYIEDITIKTGNFKKFSIFVEMLLSAMQRPNSTVSLDLLTWQDLDAVKNSGLPNRTKQFDDGKMYLIITYAVAFDRVHYPLPLVKQNSPKLSSNDARQKQLLQDMASLLKENDKLRYQIKSMELDAHTAQPSHNTQSTQAENELQSVLVTIRRKLRETLRRYPRDRFSQSAYDGLYKSLNDIFELAQNYHCSNQSVKATSKPQRSSQSSTHKKHQVRSYSNSSARLNRHSSPQLSERSGYKVIKSEPLVATRHDPPIRKSNSLRSNSRKPSMSPFRRFDPTQYILDKERKQADKRSLSRDHISRSRDVTRSSSINSNSSYESKIRDNTHQGRSSSKRIPTYSSQTRESSISINGERSISKSRPSYLQPGPTKKKYLDENSPTDDTIESRLAQLQMYLASVVD
ncbi:hypothetical protein BDEG_27510 [Batrachochytrium dendrobatidis JEL423]|uniref:Uncharacterized protein n=1 Tax=Batrachochytrium dendrobatidis (strain JEL423) TaxID=403673 RepID=A0A177WW14_BATDL|nr:hypothetical protein BDEG_27510 [Batrachochytrium dendrobatidis JEL423]